MPRTETTVVERRKSPVVVGSLVMVGVSLLLFFLPLINGLIGGAIGGYVVGTVKRALLAALLPALVVAVGLWLIFALAEAPVVGLFAGMAMGLWIVLADVGLFLGAALGGGLSTSRVERREIHAAR